MVPGARKFVCLCAGKILLDAVLICCVLSVSVSVVMLLNI